MWPQGNYPVTTSFSPLFSNNQLIKSGLQALGWEDFVGY